MRNNPSFPSIPPVYSTLVIYLLGIIFTITVFYSELQHNEFLEYEHKSSSTISHDSCEIESKELLNNITHNMFITTSCGVFHPNNIKTYGSLKKGKTYNIETTGKTNTETRLEWDYPIIQKFNPV